MGQPEFIELDETEELDFSSPECIEAVHSVSLGFKPHWSGKQLHDYYEDRELTYKQVRAIAWSENKKAEALSPEFIKKFTEKGEIENKLPNNFWDIVEELCPTKVPMEPILERLKSLLVGNSWFEKFKNLVGYPSKHKEGKCSFHQGYVLYVDGNNTGIYEIDVRNLWKKISEFTDKKDATEQVANLLYKRITS